MGFKILAINPGSTSTKVALYDEERPLLDLTLRHSAEQIAHYPNIIDQLDWRRDMILTALKEHGFDIMSLAAVIGRGGLIKPIPAGVYEVNDAMRRDLQHATMEHASNLGGLLADGIAATAGIKAYIADPVVVDEMDDIARLSGHPDCPRRSIFHALNQKATARLHCDRIGIVYEKANLVVAHLGGGISVAAHKQGRVVDVNNALDGDGPFAPERAGTLPAGELVDLCFSGCYTRHDIQQMLAGKGGLVAHLGTNSMIQVMERIGQGDEKARVVKDAMCYGIVKQIGAMAAALGGQVDAVILTGGIAHNKSVVEYISEFCSFIAPIAVYPRRERTRIARHQRAGRPSGRHHPEGLRLTAGEGLPPRQKTAGYTPRYNRRLFLPTLRESAPDASSANQRCKNCFRTIAATSRKASSRNRADSRT